MKKKRDSEENRKLSPAEERRLERFNKTAEELRGQGYELREITVGIIKANLFALVLTVPVFITGIALFFLKNRGADITNFTIKGYIVFIAVLAVLIVVHELIHGLTWGASAGMRNIEFGFMKEYLTPYCCCTAPLSKGVYILGALMPLVLLGIVPAVWAVFCGSLPMLLTGLIMTVSAAGDIMVAAKLMGFKSGGQEVLYYDHPTKAGGVVFLRERA